MLWTSLSTMLSMAKWFPLVFIFVAVFVSAISYSWIILFLLLLSPHWIYLIAIRRRISCYHTIFSIRTHLLQQIFWIWWHAAPKHKKMQKLKSCSLRIEVKCAYATYTYKYVLSNAFNALSTIIGVAIIVLHTQTHTHAHEHIPYTHTHKQFPTHFL